MFFNLPKDFFTPEICVSCKRVLTRQDLSQSQKLCRKCNKAKDKTLIKRYE